MERRYEREFHHLSDRARELLAAFAGVPQSRAELKCRVRMARVLEAFSQVPWQPKLTAARRISGMPVSTLFDHYRRMRDAGLLVEVTLRVPGGPVITCRW